MSNKARKWPVFILLTLFIQPVISQERRGEDSFFLSQLLQKDTSLLARMAASKNKYKIQILYTQINRDRKNRPHFRNFSFNLNPRQYFYPASTIKMPLAILALQKCRELGIPPDATMLTDSAFEGQTKVKIDTTAATGMPSILHYIKKVFLVSDNDASNRLYEFLGQDYIHTHFRRMGLVGAEIIHRLSLPLTEEQNRRTNPTRFFDKKGELIFQQPALTTARQYPERLDFVGKGYINDEKLINDPMNFSQRNRFPLEELHRTLQMVIFPESFSKNKLPILAGEDYRMLYQYMSQLPRESLFPRYDTIEYYDSYVKFLLFGSRKEAIIPNHLRVYNKVGLAYGFLTDVAYVADVKHKVEFFLSATIYCNNDEILNDEQYEYETIGFPFLERLGQVIYEYELGRKKKRLPDLSLFNMQYD